MCAGSDIIPHLMQIPIYLSVVEGNDQAARLYQDFGFVFNGERDTKGEHVMMKQEL